MAEEQSKIFMERLKKARELREMSQGMLAEKSGFMPAAISHFETGARKPSLENLRKLANVLQVTTDYLLGRVEDPSAHGEIAAKIARHVEHFSTEDIELTESFLAMLSQRKKKDDGE